VSELVSIFCFAERADQVIDLICIRAQGLGLEYLPGVFDSSKRDVLFLASEFNLAHFIKVGGQQAFVTKVVGRFVQAGLVEASNSENTGITHEHGVIRVTRRRLVPDQQLLSLVILECALDIKWRNAETVGSEV